MRKSRSFKFLLILFLLITVFQLTGVGEVFCDDDHVSECTDCFTCPCHFFAITSSPVLTPSISWAFFKALSDSGAFPQAPTFSFFRPPIAAA